MSDKTFLPEAGFVRLPTVLKLIPVGKSTWWEGVKSGRFPKSIKLGKRISAWRVEDIRKLIENPPKNDLKSITPIIFSQVGYLKPIGSLANSVLDDAWVEMTSNKRDV